jgi:hypothetical protein
VTPTELSKASGISVPYASQILSGARQPSRSLAIHLLRTADWRHCVLDGMTEGEIDLFEKLEPWTPPDRAIEAA